MHAQALHAHVVDGVPELQLCPFWSLGASPPHTMRLLIGLPMMRATMPRWSAFSKLWLSGNTCPRADSRCVAPAAKQNMASGPGAAAAHHLADNLQNFDFIVGEVGPQLLAGSTDAYSRIWMLL